MANEEIKNEEVEQEVQTEEVEVEVQEETPVVDEEVKFESLEEEFKAKMEAKVAEAEAKAAEAEDKFLRTHAEFDNIKKRLEKEKYSAIDYASEKFAKDMLTTIDTLDMALYSAKGDLPAEELLQKLEEGIQLTLKKFVETFEKHDITVVETDEFNPEYHNAVMQVPATEEKAAGQVVEVMQKGYMFKERLLRPAMVSVAN
jgi:molecular chaperone GrpE